MSRKIPFIGRLRRKITIQQITETRDAYGEPIKTWTTLLNTRAAIEPLMGREFWESQQHNAEKNVRFRIRHSKTAETITPKMRISWDSRTFDIQSVVNVYERNREIILMAVEYV